MKVADRMRGDLKREKPRKNERNPFDYRDSGLAGFELGWLRSGEMTKFLRSGISKSGPAERAKGVKAVIAIGRVDETRNLLSKQSSVKGISAKTFYREGKAESIASRA